jgi:hypothetical protein
MGVDKESVYAQGNFEKVRDKDFRRFYPSACM